MYEKIKVFCNFNLNHNDVFLICFCQTPLDHIDNTEEIFILPVSDLPETISREDAIARGHVARLKSEETDMHSVIFRNSDGTKSLYMFASPVKYQSTDGTIRDKSTALTQTASGYSMTDNNVHVTFGTHSSAGASMSYFGDSITLVPLGTNGANCVFQDNAVIYNGVFGNNTMLYCAPLLSGVKAAIVLRSNGTQNVFSFSVDAGDLIARQETDGVVALVNEDGEKIFKFGNYIIADANGNSIEDEPILTTNANGCYTVTIEADEAFLSDPNTAYPVIVEPTVTLNTSSAIDDTVIYSNRPNRNYGSRNYHNLGYLDETYGIGRMLVKFPGLETNSNYLNLNPTKIESASFCMYTASGYDTNVNHNTIIYRPDSSWDESTVTWGTTQSNEDVLMEYSNSIYTPRTGGSLVEYDITGVMRYWLNSTNARQCGLLFTALVELQNYPVVDFCSTEYADSHNGTYMPYLTFTYNTSDTEYSSSLHLRILYDDAFASINYDYQSNMYITTAQQIQRLMAPVISLYEEQFGIEISYSIHPYLSYPETENCLKKNNRTEYCNCFMLCEAEYENGLVQYHHKNQDIMFENIPEGDATTHINMFFTGHINCNDGDGGVCLHTREYDGVAGMMEYRIGIFNTYDISISTIERISLVIAHEIGHFYGAPDHYGEHIDPIGSNDNCMWGNYQNSETMEICEYCEFQIHQNHNEFNH